MSYKVELKTAIKTETLDQDKIFSPQKTVDKFKDKVAKLNLNILSKTERIDNGRLDIPVFFSECGSDAKEVIGTNKQMGKGATPEQSEASAVMELAERFSFFSFKNNPDNFFTDTYKNVADKALPFSMILQSVHDEGGDVEAKRKIFETLPLKWTKGYNLTQKKEVLVPFNWFYMINEFNGPCAGNCVEEAVSQGICEVVERHTSSLVSQGKLKVPGIDPASATDPMVKELVAKYNKAGISLHISDFTLEMGIPTVGVMAYDKTTFPIMSEIVWTAGTTPNPEKAMSRALTETAQLAGDFNSGSNFVASGLPKFTSFKEAEYITHPEKLISINDLPDRSNIDIKVEVENLVAELLKKGMDVILINVMHKGLEIPAFYTIIPGAHFRERAVDASVGMFSARFITEEFEPAEALLKLNQIEKLIPNQYYTNFYQGLAYLALNDNNSALKHFEKALDLEPAELNIPDICSYMGLCLKDMEQYERALEILAKGQAIDEQRIDIHNLKGFCHFKMKNHELAIKSFKKIISIDPSSAIDYANVASNYRDLGNAKTAIKYYEMALKIDPSITFAQESLERLKSAD
ncbi:MAG: tetratricopeptide repeat protein [Desulfobacteraceae bacterium]|nr:tetratricopeptide repeat protein [Desulfobacteraceae bacterium]